MTAVTLELGGYQRLKLLHSGKDTCLYEAWDEGRQMSVYLKTGLPSMPGDQAENALARELERLNAAAPGSRSALSWERSRSGAVPVIVADRGDGATLPEWTERREWPVAELYVVLMQLTGLLGELHRSGTAHWNIQLSGIHAEPESYRMSWLDLGYARKLESSGTFEPAAHHLETLLPYLSPEQTGRVNRTVDYRTDIYSLGIVMYRLMTGRHPFTAGRPEEWIHAHLVRSAPHPRSVRSDLPDSLCRIVLKCLSKQAEDRYQSVRALERDLAVSAAAYDNPQHAGSVEPGRVDKYALLQIPAKLYGREDMLSRLTDAVCGKTLSGLFIAGAPGVGKSSVIREIQARLAERPDIRIYYGKCDQYNASVPYEPFIEMFGQFIRFLLTQNRLQVMQWRERLLERLGPDVSLIAGLVPQLVHIVGNPEPVMKRTFMEEQQRFQTVLFQFVETILDEHRQIVLVVDDLHWAGPESIHMMETVMSRFDAGRITVIGVYRDTEAPFIDRWRAGMRRMREAGHSFEVFELKALPPETVNRIVSETVHQPEAHCSELGDYLYRMTGGNPYFLRELLVLLHETGNLRFDPESWTWQWDLASIEALQLSNDIVHLLTRRVRLLSEDCKRLLKVAACIGNTFNVDLLHNIYGDDTPGAALDEAAAAGLILKPEEGRYRFVHDRVQQLVYSTMATGELQDIHFRIGAVMRTMPEHEYGDGFFDMVRHINLGHEPGASPEDDLTAAEFNLEAGRRAKASTATEAALTFLKIGLQWLPDNAWENHYTLTFGLHCERLECEYLCGHIAEANGLFDRIMRHVRNPLDRAKLYRIKILIFRRLDHHEEAVAIGLKGLQEFGIALTRHPSKFEVLLSVAKTMRILKRTDIDRLDTLPPADNDELRTLINLMTAMSPSTYLLYPNLIAMLGMKIIALTVRHGFVEESAEGFGLFAVVCVKLGWMDLAARLAGRATELADRRGSLMSRYDNRFIYGAFVSHWKEHVSRADPHLREASRLSLKHGDWTFTGYTIPHHLYSYLFRGDSLASVYGRIQEAVVLTHGLKEVHFVFSMKLMRHFIERLRDGAADRDGENGGFAGERLLGEFSPESISSRKWLDFHLFSMQYEYLFENFAEALEYGRAADACTDHAMAVLLLPQLEFFAALAATAALKRGEKHPAAIRREIARRHRKLGKWARSCPDNFLHMELLVGAETERLWGDPHRAARLYEQAADAAASSGFIQFEAMIHECAGRFYMREKLRTAAETSIRKAYQGFARWGATLKCRDLERRYDWLQHPESGTDRSANGRREAGAGDDRGKFDLVDMAAIMNTAQVLSGEIVLERLLEKLMTIIVQTAGADKGCLFLAADGGLELEAYGAVREGRIETEVLQSVPIDKVPDIPRHMVYYAANTRETTVMPHPDFEGKFRLEPSADGARSMLCKPIVQNDRLFGVLYMENRMTGNVFTPGRIERLNMILSHVAISIENARLYASLTRLNRDLEEEVRKRTEFLRQSIHETEAALAEKAFLEERGRIIGEIHDTIGHTLTTVHIQLEAGKRLLDKDRKMALSKLEQSQEQVRSGMKEIKKALNMLREGDRMNEFAPSLESFIQETMWKTGVDIQYKLADLADVPAAKRNVLYRALQEGITNGIRHGESKSFKVELENDGKFLRLVLRDYGKGSDQIEYGLGLTSMKERVEALSGELRVQSVKGRGFLLAIRIPC